MNRIIEEYFASAKTEEELQGVLQRLRLLKEIMETVSEIEDHYTELRVVKLGEAMHRTLRELGVCQKLPSSS